MDQAQQPIGRARVVPRWDRLYGRGLHAGGQADLCPGCLLGGPSGLFNSSLEGNIRRAIDIREGEVLDAEAFKALIQAAVAENLRSSAPKSK
jgi:hypothetical protein